MKRMGWACIKVKSLNTIMLSYVVRYGRTIVLRSIHHVMVIIASEIITHLCVSFVFSFWYLNIWAKSRTNIYGKISVR